jgi:hypothetical protein
MVKRLVALLNIRKAFLRAMILRLVLALIRLIFLLELFIQSKLRAQIRLWVKLWQNLLWRRASTSTSIRGVEGLMVESLGRLELAIRIYQRLLTASAIAGVSLLARGCPSILVKLVWFLGSLTLKFIRHKGLTQKLVVLGLGTVDRVVHLVSISTKG